MDNMGKDSPIVPPVKHSKFDYVLFYAATALLAINIVLVNYLIGENTALQKDVQRTVQITLSQACTKYQGTWIPDFNECEGLTESICTQMGGQFNECASACRNDPGAEACIELCVPVCSF